MTAGCTMPRNGARKQQPTTTQRLEQSARAAADAGARLWLLPSYKRRLTWRRPSRSCSA